jgi:hypothetical protein
MKRFLFSLLMVWLSVHTVKAQQITEEEEVKTTIKLLFDGMRNADTTAAAKAFAPKAIMPSIAKTKDEKFTIHTESVANFMKSIATPHSEKYDERIVFTKILIDQNLASVWTDYKFYVGNTFSHCGVNSFQLLRTEEGWKIIYVIDTRRKNNCN